MVNSSLDFIQDVRAALKANQYARTFYFPPSKARRKTMNLRLGREVGYGIKDASVLTSLYSLLIVSFSFDTTGVCVDNKEFLAAVREGMTLPGRAKREMYLHIRIERF